MEKLTAVALAGDWYTAIGAGVNLGWFGKPKTKNWQKNFEMPLLPGLIMGIIILRTKIPLFSASNWNKVCCFPRGQDMRLILQNKGKEQCL